MDEFENKENNINESKKQNIVNIKVSDIVYVINDNNNYVNSVLILCHLFQFDP